MDQQIQNRLAELFSPGKYLCAESVARVIAEAGGRYTDDVARMATGFCSGVGRTCGQCGAVSGAIMGISLYSGRAEANEDHDPCYAMVQEFIDRFNETYETLNCFDLIKCDFRTPEGQKRYKDNQLRKQCILISTFAAETALAILGEHGHIVSRKEFIKARLAPCGLSCGKCLAYSGGRIQQLSHGLAVELGDNFGAYARRFESMNPIFEDYDTFKNLLDFLASGTCSGCREQGCLFQSCTIPACVKAKGVDYCFQCDEFPCDHHGLPAGLAKRWQTNNEKMHEIGVEQWFCETIDKPRYP